MGVSPSLEKIRIKRGEIRDKRAKDYQQILQDIGDRFTEEILNSIEDAYIQEVEAVLHNLKQAVKKGKCSKELQTAIKEASSRANALSQYVIDHPRTKNEVRPYEFFRDMQALGEKLLVISEAVGEE